jgi:hypothetical protein
VAAQNRATVMCAIQNTFQPGGATGTRAVTVAPGSYGSAVQAGVIVAPWALPPLGRLRVWDGTQWRDAPSPAGLRYFDNVAPWRAPVPV